MKMHFDGEALRYLDNLTLRMQKAEAEVERLQKVYAITNESWKKQVEENAQLRNVADAARALVPSEMYQYARHLFDLKHTLDEYQTWKEGQE